MKLTHSNSVDVLNAHKTTIPDFRNQFGERLFHHPFAPDKLARQYIAVYHSPVSRLMRVKSYHALLPTASAKRTVLLSPHNTSIILDSPDGDAGISLFAPQGRIDDIGSGPGLFSSRFRRECETMQELARHATSTMTMNVYGRARDEKMREAVESVGNLVFQAVHGLEITQGLHKPS
jgi:hypothetical protein